MIQSTWTTENYSRLSTIWADFTEGKTSKQTNNLLYLVKGSVNALNGVILLEIKPCSRCINVIFGSKKIVNS